MAQPTAHPAHPAWAGQVAGQPPWPTAGQPPWPAAGERGEAAGRTGSPDRAAQPARRGPARGRRIARPKRVRRRGTLLGLHSGQIVTAELAAVLLMAGAAKGYLWLAAAAPVAGVLSVIAFGRLRRRWVYEWLGLRSRYLSRRRSVARGGTEADLLALLRPAADLGTVDVDATEVGVIADPYGVTAVVELGDPAALVGEARPPAPVPAGLLPPPSADQPAVRLQLLVAGVAAPALGASAATPTSSYRQLTEGRVLAQQRAFLAVHVRRSGDFGEPELRRALASAVRRVRRRLDRDRTPGRPLGAQQALRVLGELAHHVPAHPVRENWSGLELGGLYQTCLRLRRWPDVRGEAGRTLLPRLLALPGCAVTVSLAAEHASGADPASEENAAALRVELVIRLAAIDESALGTAVGALRKLLGSVGAAAQRLDGTQLAGLAATLPLGGATEPGAAGLSGVLHQGSAVALVGGLGLRASTEALVAMELPLGDDGLMLGINRHSEAVTVRLFRPEPTRIALFGGLRAAQLVTLRAVAVGATVIVHSGRPAAWEHLARAAGEGMVLVPPGRPVEPPPATPLRPQLVVVDIGAVGAPGVPVMEGPWRSSLLVRDELTAADVDALVRADLVLLQPLNPSEAALAGQALALGEAADWLTRIRPDMVGVVAGRRALRWTLLSTTPVEQQLIGPMSR
jgi:type VII secretion protein EccE